ncbi:hypothetical protein GCM10010435_09010 [Winogradskya consettensis]|uniref:Uncharacterized protein n=1 Tax=Winogradskya consettensis TaxID=113560 RepID=A0A919SYZ9_9ACTN|nr:hypothetical protein Aco04nite_71730 [Actinoplanes consettensis]
MSVPVTFLGLLLFVVLLWPGFLYSSIQARVRPERQLTPLREVVGIVSVSLTADAIALLVFLLARVLLPGDTPVIGDMIKTPAQYASEHYRLLIAWGLGLLVFALLVAAVMAAPRLRRRLARTSHLGRMVKTRPHPSAMSAWWLAFTEYPPEVARCHLGAVLTDGSFYSGWLHSFSQAGGDGPDRELTLRAPIGYRAPGTDTVEVLDGVGMVVLSARQMSSLLVSYRAREPRPSPAAVSQSADPAEVVAP